MLKKSLILLILIALEALFVAPVLAVPVEDGDTIFVYEEDLDLSALAYGTEPVSLVKYVDDRDPYGVDSFPEINRIVVDDITSFDLLDSMVGDDYGLYYVVASDHTGTTNTVNIRYPDVTLDATLAGNSHYESIEGRAVPRSADIAFKLSTRYLAAECDRLNATVDIMVTKPSGAEIINFGEADLQDIRLDSCRFWTDDLGINIDLTDAEIGTYHAQAKWAYPLGFNDYARDSNIVSFDVIMGRVAIESNKDSLVRGNNFVVSISGESKTDYWVYVRDASLSSAEAYPVFLQGQTGVDIVSYNSGIKERAEAIIGSEYPLAGGSDVDSAVAKVTTWADGTRAVEFVTMPYTDDGTYTIKVKEDREGGSYDAVSVKIEKGEVTVTAPDGLTYLPGGEIKLSGTNTDSDRTYLFVTAPNLPSAGASLEDGSAVDVAALTGFVVRNVNSDDTWEFRWNSADLDPDPGTYTIYAASQPCDLSGLSDAVYETVSLSLVDDFTADLSSEFVAKGDDFTVSGYATGNPSAPSSVKIWMIGPDYVGPAGNEPFRAPVNVVVEDDASFEYTLPGIKVADLRSGRYFIVVQHPMANGLFDIYTKTSEDGMQVWNRLNDSAEFTLDGPGMLEASEASEALVSAINNDDTDDICIPIYFEIQEPVISIDPVGEHSVGDVFTISGTTNLAVGDEIVFDVTSTSFDPTDKIHNSDFSGDSGTVTVVAGYGQNRWSFDLDTSDFMPDEYIVKIESIKPDTLTHTTFILGDYVPEVPVDSIHLSEGANFISVPKLLAAGNNTAAIFEDVETAGHPMLRYDAQTEEWSTVSRDYPLMPMEGFWLYSTESMDIPLQYDAGYAQTPPTRSLYIGWNAIGLSDKVSAPACAALTSVEDHWRILIGYNAGMQEYETSIIRGGYGIHSDRREMNPAAGYWLYMKEDGSLAAIGA